MTLIYTQDTINYMHRINPNLLNQLGILGEPEIKELDTKIKYYKYQIN